MREAAQKLITHQSITENFESYQFTTPVAALMELSNALGDFKSSRKRRTKTICFARYRVVASLILMLAPVCAALSEECGKF